MKRVLVEISEPAPNRIRVCSGCGAIGSAGCDCNLPLLPRALAGIAETPLLSNVQIAKRIGVSESTVRRARTTSSCDEVDEKRIGGDGKTRKMPVKPARKLRRATVENSVDPLLLKISETATLMDMRSAQSIVEETQAQFDSGIGLDRGYIERLTFVRDWLTDVIQGSEKFVVTCSITED